MRRICLALALGLVGCVDEGADATVVILQNQVPEEGCVIPGSPSDLYSSSGRIDLRAPTGYLLTPVAINNATSVEGNETARMAFVEGAYVDLHFADPDLESALAGTPETRLEIPFSARIDPDGGTSGMAFEAIPRSLFDQLADRSSTLIYIEARLFGELGGSGFESKTWRFPVEVCDGCTVIDFGACAALPTSFSPTHTGNACNPYQDNAVDCCTTSTGALVCPAVGTAAAQ
jgi:hypothetical protein